MGLLAVQRQLMPQRTRSPASMIVTVRNAVTDP